MSEERSKLKPVETPASNGLWLNMLCIMIPVFLLSCGGVATSTPLTAIFLKDACEHYHIDPSSKDCKDNKDAKHYANNHLFWYLLASTLPPLLSVAAGSHISDVFGRKVALLWTTSGAVFSALLAAVVPMKYLYTVLLPLTALVNLTGGLFCSIGIIFAAVADITSSTAATQRQLMFGITEAVFWIGLLISPTISGYLSEHYGGRKSLLFPIASGTTSFIFFFLLIKTPRNHQPARFTLSKINAFANIKKFITLNHTSLRLSVTMTFNMTTVVCLSTMIPIWLSEDLKYSFTKIGLLQSLIFATNALGLMAMLPLLTYLGATPKAILLIATVSLTLWPAVWATGLSPFFAVPLSCMSSMYFPIVRTAVVAMHGPSEYGSALGIVATIQAFSTVIGSLSSPQLLNHLGWHWAFATCAMLGSLGLFSALSLPSLLYKRSATARTDETAPLQQPTPIAERVPNDNYLATA